MPATLLQDTLFPLAADQSSPFSNSVGDSSYLSDNTSQIRNVSLTWRHFSLKSLFTKCSKESNIEWIGSHPSCKIHILLYRK